MTNQQILNSLYEDNNVGLFFNYIDIKYCKCGCNQKTKWNINKGNYNDFIIYHNRRNFQMSEETKRKIGLSNSGKVCSKETKLKLSLLHKGLKHSEETKRKMSNVMKGRVFTEEWKKKIGLSNKGKTKGRKFSLEVVNRRIKTRKERGYRHSEETKRKMRESNINTWNKKEKRMEHSKLISQLYKDNPSYANKFKIANLGRKMSNETKDKVRKSKLLGYINNPEIVKKISISVKKQWKSKEFVEKWLNSIHRKPSNLEKEFDIFLQRNFPNEWKYVGDYKFFIGKKNPDFVNINGKKICIEVYGEFFKLYHYNTIDEYINKRNNYFNNYGWRCIFVSDKEFKSNIESVKNKFINIMK